MSSERPLSALGLVSLGLALAGCPGTLEDPDRFQPPDPCSDVPRVLVGPRCATSNCHDAATASAALDLTPDAGLASRIVDVAGDTCGGLLVDTAAPADSLVYTKCLTSNDCGVRMPITGAPLDEEELACLLGWVESLAGE